jgi:hypothetical protein
VLQLSALCKHANRLAGRAIAREGVVREPLALLDVGKKGGIGFVRGLFVLGRFLQGARQPRKAARQ